MKKSKQTPKGRRSASSRAKPRAKTNSAARSRPAGRPTKRTPVATKKIRDAIARGLPLHYAAALAGVSRTAFHEWRTKFPEFENVIQEAVSEGIDARLRIIERSMKTDWKAASWWLEHVMPEYFAKSRIDRLELSGPHGKPIETNNSHDPNKFGFTMEEISNLEEAKNKFIECEMKWRARKAKKETSEEGYPE